MAVAASTKLESVNIMLSAIGESPINTLSETTGETNTSVSTLNTVLPVDAQMALDVLQEQKLQVSNLVDLGFGECRMSVAVKSSSGYLSASDLPPNCRVASKFTNCAKNFFDQIDLPVQLVHLSGSVELGPITGMAEAIVDLVATGRTLRDNGLIEIEELFKSSARLVGHPLSLRLDKGPLQEIIESIQIQSQTNPLSDGKK